MLLPLALLPESPTPAAACHSTLIRSMHSLVLVPRASIADLGTRVAAATLSLPSPEYTSLRSDLVRVDSVDEHRDELRLLLPAQPLAQVGDQPLAAQRVEHLGRLFPHRRLVAGD